MPKVDSGDTTFVLVSTALVMLMTPGLAFFYGGLVRRRSVLNTMMMSFIAMGAVGVAWALVGYTLAFEPGRGPLGAVIGGLQWAGLMNVGQGPQEAYSATVPHLAFMLFQTMFAVITPALISGAVAERMKFRSYVVFCVLWSLLVYAPVAHWVWSPDGWLRKLGALDFAGGTVVHINAGAAALVAALLTGRRRGFPKTAMLPHNVPFALLGTGLLWFGWLGFNGGSALAGNGLAASAFVATFFAAASAGLAWVVIEEITQKKMTAVGFATGIVAGLVGITPASGFVGPLAAMVIGVGAAAVSFVGVRLKTRAGYDDALDVFGVHGVAGIFGAIATGAFASLAVNPAGAQGSLRLIAVQAVAALVALAWSGLVSFGVLKLIGATMGLRVHESAEVEGIDLSEHGEHGYADIETGAGLREEPPPAPVARPARTPAEETI